MDGSQIWADLRGVWPELAWDRKRITHGAFHTVACLGTETVVRVSTGRGHSDRSEAEHANAKAAVSAGLPFLVPVPIGEPHHTSHWSATVFSYISGETRESLPQAQTRDLVIAVLAALADVDVAQLPQNLSGVRAWCGGDRWGELVDECVTVLPAMLQTLAHELVQDVLALVPPPASFVHGDLGLHNLIFAGSQFVGIIDFDNATVGDPAIDLAPFVRHARVPNMVGFFGDDLLARARCHSKTLSLQVAAAARLNDDPDLERHALTNFHDRALAGTL